MSIAIDTREKLKGELKRCRVSEAEHGQLVASLTSQLRDAEKDDDRALTMLIRKKDKDSEAAREKTEAKRDELGVQLKRAELHAEASAVARKTVEGELNALYLEHFDDFAAEAEQATEQAHTALLALAEPYMAAMKAWRDAVAMWGPLGPAIRERLAAHEQETGVFPDVSYRQGASQTPPFPLPNATGVFGAVHGGTLAARPRALQPDALADDVIEETITAGSA